MAPPVDSAWGTIGFYVAGRSDRDQHNEVFYRPVSAAYFKTLQAKLLRGRYFREEDDASKPLVVIVNQALAEKYFRDEDSIGKQVYRDPKSLMEIVGVYQRRAARRRKPAGHVSSFQPKSDYLAYGFGSHIERRGLTAP